MTSIQREGFFDSMMDAVKPGNVFLKFVQFIIFGLITATPYVVKNLDMVAVKALESGASGWLLVWAYVKALLVATWIGVGIGLSTVFNTITNYGDVLSQHKIGTIIFCVVVLIFSTLMFYQPIRLLFNILDRKKGRVHSSALVMLVSLVVVVVVASPLAYLITDGGTITSGIVDDDVVVVEEMINQTNETVSNDLLAVIDLMGD